MGLARSTVVVWVAAPAILLLSSIRPTHGDSLRADQLPETIGEFSLTVRKEITPDAVRLLGTADVAWWELESANKDRMFLIAVFHETNWKSLHPPRFCIRGSNFNINAEESISLTGRDGMQFSAGRILASVNLRPEEEYVSVYAFVGRDFITPSYYSFYGKHAFRALFRQATPGFLVRAEAFVGADGPEAAEQKCRELLREFLPIGRQLISR